jgi:hypothetical protein
MRITGDEPIYPVETGVGKFNGLTIRQHFAVMAMRGIAQKKGGYWQPESIASDAVDIADALIEELNQSENENT